VDDERIAFALLVCLAGCFGEEGRDELDGGAFTRYRDTPFGLA
jgi:hypothetical protein